MGHAPPHMGFSDQQPEPTEFYSVEWVRAVALAVDIALWAGIIALINLWIHHSH